MRLAIDLKLSSGNFLPYSINSAIQGSLYKAIEAGDPVIAKKWHDEMHMKPWTFSNLVIDSFFNDRKAKSFRLVGEVNARLYVSSCDSNFLLTLMNGLENQRFFRILSCEFEVEYMEIEEVPEFTEGEWHKFGFLSGYCASKREPNRKYKHFFTILDPELVPQLINNAKRKYEEYTGVMDEGLDLEIKIDRKFALERKSGYLVKYKLDQKGETNVYANTVPLVMKGTPELIRFLYEAGLGERSSSGFGMMRYMGVSREHGNFNSVCS